MTRALIAAGAVIGALIVWVYRQERQIQACRRYDIPLPGGQHDSP